MKRKTLISLACLAVLLGGLFLFRQQIAINSARLFLNKSLGEGFSCKEISTSKGNIEVSGFSVVHEQLDMKMDHLSFSVDFKQVLLHPSNLLKLYRKRSSHWSTYLSAMKQYGVALDVEKGSFILENRSYYFTFESGEKKHEIGTLQISLDPHFNEFPFLIAQFHMRGDQLISQLKVDEVESERFFHLGAFAFPRLLEGYTDTQGTIQMHASVIFEQDGKIDEISTRFQAKDLTVSIPKKAMRLGFDNLRGELNYPEGLDDPRLPMWKRMDCNLKLEKGWVETGRDVRLSGLSGWLGLDPREDPSLNMTGEVESGGKSLAMDLKGKGAIHEDHAYWLEFDLRLDDRQGTHCDSFLSICRPEQNAHVIQLEANGLLPAQVEMLKGYFARMMPKVDEWSVVDGTFGGKLVALFESGKLAHFEVQDMTCEKVSLVRSETPFFFSKITAHGRLFEELKIGLVMPTSHFLGLLFDPLRLVYDDYCPDDYVRLSSSLAFSGNNVITSATVNFPLMNQAIDFGFTSPVAFPSRLEEIEKGWVRSEKITHELYGPIVRLAAEDLKVYGDVDLIGGYDGSSLDLLIQVDNLLTKHPFVDFKADRVGEKDQTTGRIRLVYEPCEGAYSLDFPLVGAAAYEKTYGMTAQDLDAHISVSGGGVEMELQRAQFAFDGHPLASEVRGVISLNDEIQVSDLRVLLPFSTDKHFYLEVEKWTPKMCRAKLFDDTLSLASCELIHGENWLGKLQVDSLNQELELTYGWSPQLGHAECLIRGDNLQLMARKEGAKLHIDTLEALGVHCRGVIGLGRDIPHIESLHIAKGGFSFEVQGGIEWEMPTTTSPFYLRSTLELSGAYDKGVPIRFASSKPFHLGLSLPMGGAISGLSLISGENTLDLSQMEYLIEQGKVAVNQAAFSFTPDFVSTLTAAGVLPKVADNLAIENVVEGVIHSTHQENAHTLTAAINRAESPLCASLEWSRDQATLQLGQEENLIAKFTRGEKGGYSYQSLKGKWEDIEANLASNAKGDLKGSLTLDLGKSVSCIEGTLANYLRNWNVGGKVMLTGLFSPAEQLSNWAFKGRVKGRDVEWKGYRVDTVDAKMEIEPGQIAIENGDITDEAGKGWVSEGAVMLSGDTWMFSFPSVELRSFQPSFVRKVIGAERAINPLVIKSATLKDVRGELGDSRSISASGKLHFSNISKKGESAVPRNLPVQALRGMGLDGSLFVPASGKLDYLIQGGRVYLRSIEDLISDKGRSQFSPPRNGVMGYVDFDGKVYLDVQVRQNVVRSLSGPINMKVRGNIADPEITIR